MAEIPPLPDEAFHSRKAGQELRKSSLSEYLAGSAQRGGNVPGVTRFPFLELAGSSFIGRGRTRDRGTATGNRAATGM
jgi:hypothetical protein